ncbi:hypothetical protein Tco_0386857 [Tanacetum coccineum]
MHVHFWNICSDEKGRVAWSESKSIQNNLKCGFFLDLSRIESSIAFPNLKSFLLGNKFKIKFGLLSSQPKKKKANNVVFVVYFRYDRIFTSCPFKYARGEMKEVNDTNFDEMSYEHLLEIVKRLVPHNSNDDDNYSSDDCQEIDNVDFQTKDNTETPEVDPDDNQIDFVYNVQRVVVYPAFDPDILWDKMEPMLGMRYESPHQLKMALANYGVAYGFQLWTGVSKRKQVNKAVKNEVVKKKRLQNLWRTPDYGLFNGFGVNTDLHCALCDSQPDSHAHLLFECPFSAKCMRAKQLALFDHEGGLIEHYGKLYQYRQALLDSNLGSTCRRNVDESTNGGELLTAMGRDANNQMYPIAWAVVRVENADY